MLHCHNAIKHTQTPDSRIYYQYAKTWLAYPQLSPNQIRPTNIVVDLMDGVLGVYRENVISLRPRLTIIYSMVVADLGTIYVETCVPPRLSCRRNGHYCDESIDTFRVSFEIPFDV